MEFAVFNILVLKGINIMKINWIPVVRNPRAIVL